MLKSASRNRRSTSAVSALAVVGCSLLVSAAPVRAVDLTYERLLNPEPQNWLMNHHDYTSQRFSALEAINKTNVKNLKLLFAIEVARRGCHEDGPQG